VGEGEARGIGIMISGEPAWLGRCCSRIEASSHALWGEPRRSERAVEDREEPSRIKNTMVGGTSSEDLVFSVRRISRIGRDAAASARARTIGVGGGLELHAELTGDGLSNGRHLRGLDSLERGAVVLLNPIRSVKKINLGQAARTFFARLEALEVLSFIFK
jgi:hypothetical protein